MKFLKWNVDAVVASLSTTVTLAVPILWTSMGVVGFVLMLIAYSYDMVSYMPSAEKMLVAIGSTLSAGSEDHPCYQCGVAAQVAENNGILMTNPFYGMRTTQSIDDDDLAKHLTVKHCLDYPCTPGCQGLIDDTATRIDEETFQATNHSLPQTTSLNCFLAKDPIDNSSIHYVFLHAAGLLMETRFTLRSGKDRDVYARELLFDGKQPRSTEVVPPHRHMYDHHGICQHCSRVRTEAECHGTEAQHVPHNYFTSAMHTVSFQPCPTCGIIQDLRVPRPVRWNDEAQGQTSLYSSAWFMHYPLNKFVKSRCESHCDLPQTSAGRWKLKIYRFIIRFHIHSYVLRFRAQSRLSFTLLQITYLLLFAVPGASINGNLVWRNTLHGMPTSAAEGAAGSREARVARNLHPSKFVRLRKK